MLVLAEKTWQARPAKMFNGSLLMHTGTILGNEEIELTGLFTEYRFYYAQKKNQVDFGLAPISVSGLMVCGDQVIFARRRNVTSYAGWWELVPSGTLDLSVARDDSTVDFRTKLLQEFEEEVGLPAGQTISAVTSFAVIYDPMDTVYDIACQIQLEHSTPEPILKGLEQSKEYESPVAVPVPHLDAWLQENQQSLVPTSQGILKAWR